MPRLVRSFKTHVRRKLLLGLLIFAPFGLTIFVLVKLVNWGKEVLTRPLLALLERARDAGFSPAWLETMYNEKAELKWWIDYSTLFISIFLTLFALYLIGLLSATFFGRRYIAAGEKVLARIPGAQFVYNTVKQLVDMLSRPKTEAFKKVVLVEYPRTDVWAVAFFTGYTPDPKTGRRLINVFLPSTPNPTTGFLLVLPREQVQLTNLTVSQAFRFIFSFGVVQLEHLKTEPFPVGAIDTEPKGTIDLEEREPGGASPPKGERA